jgi:hypothetical protein
MKLLEVYVFRQSSKARPVTDTLARKLRAIPFKFSGSWHGIVPKNRLFAASERGHYLNNAALLVGILGSGTGKVQFKFFIFTIHSS